MKQKKNAWLTWSTTATDSRFWHGRLSRPITVCFLPALRQEVTTTTTFDNILNSICSVRNRHVDMAYEFPFLALNYSLFCLNFHPKWCSSKPFFTFATAKCYQINILCCE